ncbi:hypothetical protein AB0C84_12255 [Actinomadura sp. NPDC048955]|uniref:hypothetical protein n=1 Tax=Actinomadura sp. NPDC048955 TaxID=3158228 RepID=UPI0033C7839A
MTNDACLIVVDPWEQLRSDLRYDQVEPRSYLFTVARRLWTRRSGRETAWRSFLESADDTLAEMATASAADAADLVVDQIVVKGVKPHPVVSVLTVRDAGAAHPGWGRAACRETIRCGRSGRPAPARPGGGARG